MDDRQNKTRKEREREARTDLFLDIARDLIARDGFAQLSMNTIAEMAEYSKGTIYLHFASREMVLMELCLRGLKRWEAFTDRAVAISGSPLERLLGCHWAHLTYAMLNPVEYDALFLVRASSIREKISDSAHETFDAHLEEIFAKVQGVVESAVESGDTSLPAGLSAGDLTYGLWAVFGNKRLRQRDLEAAHKRGLTQAPGIELCDSLLRIFINGVGWAGANDVKGFADLSRDTREKLFGDEIRQVSAALQAPSRGHAPGAPDAH